ncbi:molybdate ABC transporter substrate-binding protein [Flavobacterium rhizosphaerae]|uniref:Molybdate ABC transporter substrate-binding protein n=1 Tax=Flavobacterium rhizosphaerae TaxID=3163298 RepID=A0ABW8YUH9_9FLAO
MFLFALFIPISACTQQKAVPVRIAVAANMQFAIDSLITDFHKETGINCELVIGSSGKLTAQIKAGAPYDIFVSADMRYPQELYKSGLTTVRPKIYAYGTLVMWSLKKTGSLTVGYLNSSEVAHIAVADEKLAPYGAAAMQYLEAVSMKEELKRKFVVAQSISGVNQYITTHNAEVGFTAKSVLLSPEMKGKGSWISIPENYYEPLAQGAVIISHEDATAKQQKNVKEFYQYLFSESAHRILKSYGYEIKKGIK